MQAIRIKPGHLKMLAIFLLSLPLQCIAQVFPCVGLEPISWVRDQNFCNQYYICHFGQPLQMPLCPGRQVWSNRALNCVPEFSRFDDCNNKVSGTTRRGYTSTDRKNYQITRGNNNINNLQVPPTADSRANLEISVKQLPIVQPKTENQVTKDQADGLKNFDFVEGHITTRRPLYRTRKPQNILGRQGLKKSLPKSEGKVVRLSTTTQAPRPNTTHGQVVRTSPPLKQWRQQGGRTRGRYQGSIKIPLPVPQQQQNKTLEKYGLDQDHQCIRQPGALFPHPENCHWYINCSLANLNDDTVHSTQLTIQDTSNDNREGLFIMTPFRVRQAGVFVWECRYPQLFDEVTGKCREFLNVKCGSRFEAVDQCEYSARQCHTGRCIPCERRFGRCRGRKNGIYPLHTNRWTPVFVTCYLQRNIAQDECEPPTPIFSPESLECVSLFEVPKQHGGFLPDCSTRPDGYYPDEQGRCAIFFRCSLGIFRGYDECPPGSVFDPIVPSCLPFSLASKPCGEGQAPLCGGKQNGLYADPYGRCTHYFECDDGIFQEYDTCDLGIFDPLTQKCVISAEQTLRPCGIQPNPCEALPTGVYPDQATGCKHFIECHQGIMITNGTCERGLVFSAITGRCDRPENAPPPCGFSDTCIGRPDGRYPALTRGCSFFYECYHEEFISLRRCTAEDGGFFFNPATGRCDYPQNICPPCGYRWWGCARTYQL